MAAALLEAAEIAAEIIEAAKLAEELGTGAYDLATSAYRGLKRIFGTVTQRYEPVTNFRFARSFTFIELPRLQRVLLRMQNINYSLYYEREYARSLVSSITHDHSMNFFVDGIFREDVVVVIISRQPFLIPFSLLSRSLSLSQHPTNDELTTHRELYYTSTNNLLALVNDRSNIYDKQKFEHEFDLKIVVD
ncbi:ORF2 [Adelphocoris suturalis virus]|uniref:ORF2 n=1 Tax=Adelphocoris suturalis virus TaxID=1930920 RepID=UPI0009508404|nr:ORF2 [Adelphocoris suturalis virus]APT35494.1 ORF2 [Adelphocoris suturalis virus]